MRNTHDRPPGLQTLLPVLLLLCIAVGEPLTQQHLPSLDNVVDKPAGLDGLLAATAVRRRRLAGERWGKAECNARPPVLIIIVSRSLIWLAAHKKPLPNFEIGVPAPPRKVFR